MRRVFVYRLVEHRHVRLVDFRVVIAKQERAAHIYHRQSARDSSTVILSVRSGLDAIGRGADDCLVAGGSAPGGGRGVCVRNTSLMSGLGL